MLSENKKRQQFMSLLKSLAQSENVLSEPSKRAEYYKELENLYYSDNEDNFRHYYSDIFSILSDILQDSDKGNILYLSSNMRLLYLRYKPINKDVNGNVIDISNNIKKLYDHVNLEVSRIDYINKLFNNVKQDENMNSLISKINTYENERKNFEAKQDEIKAKISNQEKEYITILGIFAAIVLAFTGGFSFTSSIFDNLNQASIYRTLILTLVIGFVLVNMLYGLFFYINSLLNKSTSIKPILYFNLILLFLVLLVIISWLFGFVEWRNALF
ncbi:hypothetical protein H5983_07700 [Faecalitalea cylindroides]|uniref:hypothetical protein n=1 Tax=Faecalitalea cylindroides TaxID=39483 RepID=UPI00195CC4B8|nr:hypothetical protein [Faecalitalea cylindroides]MBM6810951.1 hypothetical protein [Faecalitalea cylindroides]